MKKHIGNSLVSRARVKKRDKMAVEILYESENFLIVNKPYDMYINSDDEKEKVGIPQLSDIKFSFYSQNTIAHHIASGDSHLSTSVQPLHFVQRLDYSTSGVLCIAKNKNSAAVAGKLFEKRLTGKYYLAVVRGHAKSEVCDIEFRVGIDPTAAHTSHKMTAMMSSDSLCDRSKQAHTRMLLLETGYYNKDPVSVVLLKPITGRRHQLRVHCSSVGHTILGDYTYSGGTDNEPHRMFLHATRLVLPTPQEPLDIMTPEPFFCDSQFVSKWKPHRTCYKYKTKEDFLKTCEILDKDYVIGVSYSHLYCSE